VFDRKKEQAQHSKGIEDEPRRGYLLLHEPTPFSSEIPLLGVYALKSGSIGIRNLKKEAQ